MLAAAAGLAATVVAVIPPDCQSRICRALNPLGSALLTGSVMLAVLRTTLLGG
jgi:hypothetical protein